MNLPSTKGHRQQISSLGALNGRLLDGKLDDGIDTQTKHLFEIVGVLGIRPRGSSGHFSFLVEKHGSVYHYGHEDFQPIRTIKLAP